MSATSASNVLDLDGVEVAAYSDSSSQDPFDLMWGEWSYSFDDFSIFYDEFAVFTVTQTSGIYVRLDETYLIIETEVAPVPEPTTMLLFGTGIIGLAAVSRRRK